LIIIAARDAAAALKKRPLQMGNSVAIRLRETGNLGLSSLYHCGTADAE
jgi:hypothetical protein